MSSLIAAMPSGTAALAALQKRRLRSDGSVISPHRTFPGSIHKPCTGPTFLPPHSSWAPTISAAYPCASEFSSSHSSNSLRALLLRASLPTCLFSMLGVRLLTATLLILLNNFSDEADETVKIPTRTKIIAIVVAVVSGLVALISLMGFVHLTRSNPDSC
jgi:hypothetical protein